MLSRGGGMAEWWREEREEREGSEERGDRREMSGHRRDVDVNKDGITCDLGGGTGKQRQALAIYGSNHTL
jgi:hypothetical protein